MRRFLTWASIACLVVPQVTAAQSILSVLLSAPPSSLSTSGLVLRLEADNLGSQWQTIAGTTAVAADGDVVGTWNDLSTNAFNFTATADDGTRLTHKIVNGVHSNSCDGTDDKLRRAADLGLYAAGAATLMIAFTHDTTDTGTIFGIGKAGNSAPVYQIANTVAADSNDIGAFIRNDSSTTIINATTVDEGLPASVNYVVTIVDTGSTLLYYVDGNLVNSSAYTRSGVVTLDQTGICTDAKNTFGAFPKLYVQGVWAWTRAQNASEVMTNFRYAKKKQGR